MRDSGFDVGVEGGLVGKGTGAVFFVFEGLECSEGADQGKNGGAVEPELGVEKPGGTDEDLGVVEEDGLGLQVVVAFVEAIDQGRVA